MNSEVNSFFSEAKKWQKEIVALRTIILDCGLNEVLKWRFPCYIYKNNNIVLIHVFKDYCALLFFKGALLQDADGVLLQPTENTQSSRQIRFTTLKEIREMESILKTYIFEAIEVEKLGLKVELKKTKDYFLPEEFQIQLNKNSNLKKAFESLTPGRQRAYLLYFSAPKQSKTIVSRIEAYTQRILNGKGLTDCVCGLSKRMPSCDGSHKLLASKQLK